MQNTQVIGTIPEWTAADRLRKARLHARLEQTELAARIGIARSTITRYETGLAIPSRPVFLSWALCTGVDLEWLVGRGEIIVRCSRPPLQAHLHPGPAAITSGPESCTPDRGSRAWNLVLAA